jgi:multidrug resistance efflux pump
MNRFLWLVMLLLLIGTAVGAGWAFQNGAGPFGKGAHPAKGADEAPAPPMVVALGFVDGEPTVAKPAPLVQGRVVYVIAEGTEVKQSDVLLKVESGLQEATVNEAKAALADVQEKLNQAQDLPEQHRLKQEQQEKAIAAADAEKKATERDKDAKLDQAKKSGVEVNKLLLDAMDERLKLFDFKVAVEKAKLEELKLFKPRSEINRAQADKDAKAAQLAKAQWALEQCTLLAPSDGLVLRVSISPSELLAAGIPGQAPPIQFLPKGQKIIRAEVLQEWASLVRIGQEVEIEDDTYQGPVWKGKVKSLSNWFAPKRNRVLEPFMINDVLTLECIIEVLDESPPLRIGQRVRVKIKTK